MKTTLYTALCVAIRLSAVLLAVSTMVYVPGALVGAPGQQFGPGATWIVAGAGVATLVLAFMLWLYPGMLARMAAGRATHEVFDSPIDAETLLRIAMTLLGMWFALNGLVDLLREALRAALVMHGEESLFGEMRRQELVMLLSFGAQVLLGLITAVGAKGLAALLFRLRHAGSPPAARSADSLEGEV